MARCPLLAGNIFSNAASSFSAVQSSCRSSLTISSFATKLTRDAYKKKQGVIFLVPEISLTPQMITRFKGEFGSNVAIMHSRLTSAEKYDEWKKIYLGEKTIVLGVRSKKELP